MWSYRDFRSIINPTVGSGRSTGKSSACSRPATPRIEEAFNDLFVDALFDYHERLGTAPARRDIADEYYHRPDKAANILAEVETQCKWLREIGYVDVDCFFKIFELALFGGVRPTDPQTAE
jgi:hypothetical protein